MPRTYNKTNNLRLARNQVEALGQAANTSPLREEWANAVTRLIGIYITIPNLRGARDLLEELEAAAQKRPNEPILHDLWASVVVEVIRAYGAIFAERHVANGLLTRAYSQTPLKHSKNSDLRGKWAKQVGNLVGIAVVCADVEHLFIPKALVEALACAVNEFPKDTFLRAHWARATADLAAACGRYGSNNTNFDLVNIAVEKAENLAQAVQEHPKDATLLKHWAKAASGVVATCRRNEQMDRAWAPLDLLEKATREHPDDLALREQWALAVVHVIWSYKYQGENSPLPRSWVDKLQKAVKKYPKDMELHGHWISAVRETFSMSSRTKMKKKGHRLMREALKRVNQRRPKNSTSRALWATRLAQAFQMAHFMREGEFLQTARNLLAALQEATLAYPSESILREKWIISMDAMAKAFTNALHGLSGPFNMPEDLGDVRGMKRGITRAVKDFPKEPSSLESKAIQMVGMLDMLRYFRHAELVETGHSLVDTLHQTTLQYPDDPALFLLWVNGTNSLLAAYGAAKNVKKARMIFDASKRVIAEYSTNPAVQNIWHMTISEMIGIYRCDLVPNPYKQNANLAEVHRLLNVLGQEVEKYPENRDLRKGWSQQILSTIYAHNVKDNLPSKASSVALSNRDGPQAMIPFLKSLSQLYETYTQEPILQKNWMEGILFLTKCCRQSKDLSTARALFDTLETVVRSDPYLAGMRSGWASEANYLIEEYRLVKDSTGMRELQESLDQMAKDYPSERAHRIKYGPGPRMYEWSL